MITGFRGTPLRTSYLKLFKSLVLPVMAYGAAAQKEFGTVQRTALLKATGLMANMSLETLELVSKSIPMHFHLKFRQAEEMIMINSKNEGEQVLEEFNNSMEDTIVTGERTTFNMLLSTFNELKMSIFLENVAKDFKYTKDLCFLTDRTTQIVHGMNWRMTRQYGKRT